MLPTTSKDLYSWLMGKLPWVLETFHAQLLVLVKSLFWSSLCALWMLCLPVHTYIHMYINFVYIAIVNPLVSELRFCCEYTVACLCGTVAWRKVSQCQGCEWPFKKSLCHKHLVIFFGNCSQVSCFHKVVFGSQFWRLRKSQPHGDAMPVLLSCKVLRLPWICKP